MGNDGGTIPSRREILNFNARKLHKLVGQGLTNTNNSAFKEQNSSRLITTLKYCRLSNKRLSEPIVSDYKGQLFNKEAVVEYLLDKSESGGLKAKPEFSHINSLGDVVEIHLVYDEVKQVISCPLSEISIDLKNESLDDLTKIELCYIVPCGCCMDRFTLHELVELQRNKIKEQGKKTSDSDYLEAMKCPVCGGEFNTRDVVSIGGSNTLRDKRIEELKKLGLRHSLKPIAKKSKKKHKKRKHSDDDNDHKDGKDKKEHDSKKTKVLAPTQTP
ncbi:unnamed protein product [Ambrosiozyma monospora]|uniref:Unnamed protein product n=1 Tax=Ambrosiozyma monospora TaxID=43982 RepID=A0ACB5T957_AMBMO|nr:unnamed protein product [Ambrosiozyma monospora]